MHHLPACIDTSINAATFFLRSITAKLQQKNALETSQQTT